MEEKILPDNKSAISLFRKVLLIRRFEEKVAALYPEQEMRCPVHLSIGQEGAAAGVIENLGSMDAVFSNHRSHGHYIAAGGNLGKLLAEFYGKKEGCSHGRGGSMHLCDRDSAFFASTSIVSGTIPIAVGTALAKKMKKEDGIAAVFFGEGSMEEGTFCESLNYAALRKLPVLFVCENNLYAIFSHIRDRQPARPLTELPRSYGIESFSGNGNDAVEVYLKSRHAVSAIRKGKGPAFLEFRTYRLIEHCGPNNDDHFCYRCEEEIKAAKNDCPLENIRRYCLSKKILTREQIDEIEAEAKKKVEDAVIFAKNGTFPGREELFDNLYSR